MGKVFARKLMETADGSYTLADVPNLWKTSTITALKGFVKTNELVKERYVEIVGKPYID